MKIVAGAARRNQLFLTTAAALGGTELLPLYDYLNRKLVVIAASDAHRWLNRFAKAPDVQPHDPSDDHNAALLSLFAKADTGSTALSRSPSCRASTRRPEAKRSLR